MKRILKSSRFWGLLIALALLAFCVKDIRASDVRSLCERVQWEYVLPSIGAAIIFVVARAFRWKVIIAQQARIGYGKVVALYSAGQVVNMAMPALTGQVGRLIVLSRKMALSKTYVFSTLVLEVLFDALSLIFFMLVTSLVFAFPSKYRTASILVAVGTLFILIVLYLIISYQQNIEETCRRRLSKRWPGAYITIKKAIRSFVKGINMLKSSQHVAGSMILSLISWTCHVLAIWFLFKSFGFQLPVPAAAVVMIINTLVLMIPITPGNAGTFEVAVSTSLAAMSVGRSDAVLFALALHLLDLLPIVIMGAWFFRFEKVSLREIEKEHEDEIIFEKISEDGTFIEEDKPKRPR
ncbi:hypothetical protein C3F09_11950 [candidate division GN15 bacterium]|uniref:Flippase-like domain-containing protein n=1 Tax=candidate division GN15 bacterium TaxID=2072418 RepID=A0A855WZZ9_9BACT|nr:MAG: hypothetical protein C3F09_11950 [candidate division GN15 bacterium]